MVEGKVEIFLSYKEPEYRDNLLWLRPYLDREGYELLYYGVNGWTRLVPCHKESYINNTPADSEEVDNDAPLLSIEPRPIKCTDDNLYEITTDIVGHQCECPN